MNAGAAAKDTRANVFPIFSRRLLPIALLLIVLIAAPGLLLLVSIAMLPTGVAFVVDSSREKLAVLSVGATNFAAITPFVPDLWLHTGSVGIAGAILTDAFAMTAIYAAAAVGWFLHLGISPLVATAHRIRGARRVGRLRIRQQQLIEVWGEGVAQHSDRPPG